MGDLEAVAYSLGDITYSEAEASLLHRQGIVRWRTSLLAFH